MVPVVKYLSAKIFPASENHIIFTLNRKTFSESVARGHAALLQNLLRIVFRTRCRCHGRVRRRVCAGHLRR